MKILNIAEELRNNSYPGRGIILGRSADNSKAVIAYFIMGRSVNSRNRIFDPVPERGGICTMAADPAKLEDPSLIIYNPVLTLGKTHIVTNGDQTDTIRDTLQEGHCYRHGLHQRTFEPDAPNYTPRISGVVKPDGSYNLSILKSFNGDPSCCRRYFFEYDAPVAGYGHFIHTYQGDGNPLPSFEGEPEVITIESPTAQAFADLLWENLNGDNKVSLFVRYIDLASGETDDVIVNANV